MKLTLLTSGLPPYVTGPEQTHSRKLAQALMDNRFDLDVYHVAAFADWKAARQDGTDSLVTSERLRIHRFAPTTNRFFRNRRVDNAKKMSEQFLRRFLAYPSSDLVYARGLTAHAFLKARDENGLELPTIITDLHDSSYLHPPTTFSERLRYEMQRSYVQYVIDRTDYIVSYGGLLTELLESRYGVASKRILEIPVDVDAFPEGHVDRPEVLPHRFALKNVGNQLPRTLRLLATTNSRKRAA